MRRAHVPAPYIPILTADGQLLGGSDLFPPNRVQSYTAAQHGVPASAYSATADDYAASVASVQLSATWDDVVAVSGDVAAGYLDVEALLARTTEGDSSALQPIFDDIPGVNADNFVDKLPEIREHYQGAFRYELVTRLAALSTASAPQAQAPTVGAASSYNDLPTWDEIWALVFGCWPTWDCAIGIRDAANEARASAVARFPNLPLYLDQGDAYRHGIWAALIVNKTANSFSSVADAVGFARKFTNAHEAGNPSSIYGDTAMDLHNKAFSLDYISGVSGTRRFKNYWLIVWIYKTVVTTPSVSAIEEAVYQSALKGLPFDNIDQLACLKLAWLGTFGKCAGNYEFVPEALGWPEAKAACVARGQHLVTIGSAAENSYVRSLAPNETHVWTGLSKVNGQWLWVDGSAPGFTNWGSGEPNNAGGAEKYVEIRPTSDGDWNDLPDTWRIPYVCESE